MQGLWHYARMACDFELNRIDAVLRRRALSDGDVKLPARHIECLHTGGDFTRQFFSSGFACFAQCLCRLGKYAQCLRFLHGQRGNIHAVLQLFQFTLQGLPMCVQFFGLNP